MQHDAYAPPPGDLRARFKKWQKSSLQDINSNTTIIDTASLEHDERVCIESVSRETRLEFLRACDQFVAASLDEVSSTNCFEVNGLSGLFIYPSLFPIQVQISLLNKLLHRDLGNAHHKTNLHLHYEGLDFRSGTHDQDESWFAQKRDLTFQAIDPSVHKDLTIEQALSKKLRWVTLGGQYDWTNKVYPNEEAPDFPDDIAKLLKGRFPDVEPQAAILNFYSPGDTLSLHRDVSEDCDQALISVSIGCDALFMVSNDDASKVVTIRLRSGDVVLMSAQSRFAWHCVPKIIPDTCPKALCDWPAFSADNSYDQWKGWLSSKRVNLNVRQMHSTSLGNSRELSHGHR